uniref:Uncharacterized protein n=1 Tax=Anguilla anguilla TaxID=7936 RepID=A0A0E9VTX9_ANGAN
MLRELLPNPFQIPPHVLQANNNWVHINKLQTARQSWSCSHV